MSFIKKHIPPAMCFVILMGVVSLFADMTQEGARSIFGDYLSLMGASAAAIGFITGFGELVGYALRFFTGIIASKSKQYWAMTIGGYALAVLAIPCLSLVPHGDWVAAGFFIVLGRVGKAIRQPAKSTLLSYAAMQQGVGKSFAIQEFLDQTGAFLGPVVVFLVLWYSKTQDALTAYTWCFAFFLIPALCCIGAVISARVHFPHPENFEPPVKEKKPFHFRGIFLVYMIGISIFAFGYIDFPLITMHAARLHLVQEDYLPLLYSIAMAVDAISALFFGWLYDKKGIGTLAVSTLVAAPFAWFCFMGNTTFALCAGVLLWGIGMGAQESTMKAVISSIVPADSRAAGYGIFETSFGIFWFIGSALLGLMYDYSPALMAAVSVGSQLLAIPFFLYTGKHS
jgi:MFS family permease